MPSGHTTITHWFSKSSGGSITHSDSISYIKNHNILHKVLEGCTWFKLIKLVHWQQWSYNFSYSNPFSSYKQFRLKKTAVKKHSHLNKYRHKQAGYRLVIYGNCYPQISISLETPLQLVKSRSLLFNINCTLFYFATKRPIFGDDFSRVVSQKNKF